MATKRKRAVRGKLTFPAPPDRPSPGRWRVMQTFGQAVCQWAWTCPECETTEYVLVQPPRQMDRAADRLETCPKCGCNGSGRYGPIRPEGG